MVDFSTSMVRRRRYSSRASREMRMVPRPNPWRSWRIFLAAMSAYMRAFEMANSFAACLMLNNGYYSRPRWRLAVAADCSPDRSITLNLSRGSQEYPGILA